MLTVVEREPPLILVWLMLTVVERERDLSKYENFHIFRDLPSMTYSRALKRWWKVYSYLHV